MHTVGDTILIWVKPGFSLEVGKGFRKRENDGGKDYQIKANEASQVGLI